MPLGRRKLARGLGVLSCTHFAMIRHTVVFRLKHAPGSEAERDFLQAAQDLAEIPGVQSFECLRQVSLKNPYHFGLSMEFATTADYQSYNEHPDHVRFVQERWIPEVAEFMEIDYERWAEDGPDESR